VDDAVALWPRGTTSKYHPDEARRVQEAPQLVTGAIIKSRDRGCSRGAHSNRSSRSIAYCATSDSRL